MAKEIGFVDPLGSGTNVLKYNKRKFTFGDMESVLAANQIFDKDGIDRYGKFNRYGYIDPHSIDQVSREFLFFTKPDLNIFNGVTDNSELNEKLKLIPFFLEAYERNRNALKQLQYSVANANGILNPFMYLLSNTVTSKLDLPSISAESRESTPNIMGTAIQYRGHSYKSDNGYDFSLSFTDTSNLELYALVKAYDEYIRLLKVGEIEPKRDHIINRIIPEQFSIYKFLIGNDGETILYYAKLTGCYFTDVPRSDMSDPGNDGFKYSISFHAQFVEDSNPMIINEFNRISPANNSNNYADVYNYKNNVVDNAWVRWPKIIIAKDKRASGKKTSFEYRMKWIK